MTKQFLYIVDPLPSLHVKTDTTLALIKESHKRHIKTYACELNDIYLLDGKVHFMSAPVELHEGYVSPPTYLEAKSSRSADDFHAIFMRKDPPVDENFLAALFMLRCHDQDKTVMINDPTGMLIANEKLFGQKNVHEFFAPTLVASEKKVIEDFINKHEKIVLKPLFNAGGAGVLVFEKSDRNLISALEILTKTFEKPVMVQAYIKNARAGDKRIIVLGGKPIGAIIRLPHNTDHRANFHAGGSPKAAMLERRDHEIADKLKPYLLDLGLHLVGIDVIDGYLTEINVTSPTCIIEIENLSQKASEQPLRAQIIDYVEGLIA